MKKGFTLLELMVVVFIIATLAAIALPNYEMAVERSRATTGLLLAEQIARANDAYYSEMNSYANDMKDLDIKIDGTGQPPQLNDPTDTADGLNRVRTKFFEVGVATAYSYKGFANAYPLGSKYIIAVKNDGTAVCGVYSAADTVKYGKLCTSMGGKPSPSAGLCLNVISQSNCYILPSK